MCVCARVTEREGGGQMRDKATGNGSFIFLQKELRCLEKEPIGFLRLPFCELQGSTNMLLLCIFFSLSRSY